MQGMGVSSYTRVCTDCACALVVLTYLYTCLDCARSPSYHGQLFAGPHAQTPGDKSEETLVFPIASFVDVGVKEEKLWLYVPTCQHVGRHSCSRAIYNSVCIWYIVERAQTRNCGAGCFRRLGAFVVGPASTSSEVIRVVLNVVCGLTCPPRFQNTHAVCAMSCACVLSSHLHCVCAWARIYAHHAVAIPVAVAVSLSLSLSQSLMSIALLQALFHSAWL